MSTDHSRLNVFAVLAALFLGAAPGVYAEDFTFNVPIELSQLHPDIKQGGVNIQIFDGSADFMKADLLKHLVGAGATTFEIKGGAFSKTVTVKFNALEDRTPGDAVYYRATLLLLRPPMGLQPAARAMRAGDKYAHDESKPFATLIIGKLNDPSWKFEDPTLTPYKKATAQESEARQAKDNVDPARKRPGLVITTPPAKKTAPTNKK